MAQHQGSKFINCSNMWQVSMVVLHDVISNQVGLHIKLLVNNLSARLLYAFLFAFKLQTAAVDMISHMFVAQWREQSLWLAKVAALVLFSRLLRPCVRLYKVGKVARSFILTMHWRTVITKAVLPGWAIFLHFEKAHLCVGPNCGYTGA